MLPFIISLSILLRYCFVCFPSGLIQKLVLVANLELASVLVVDQKLVVALEYMVRKQVVSLAVAAADVVGSVQVWV